MALGRDGNIWYLDTGRKLVGRITPAGQIAQFTIPQPVGGARAIAAGPDGNLWIGSNGGGQNQPDWILRVSPQGQVTKFQAGSNPGGGFGTGPESITAGPDGNLWFTEFWTGRIARMTPDGLLTEFSPPGGNGHPRGIVAGPDGNLWFTETDRNRVAIGRITLAGAVTEFPLTAGPADLQPYDIAAGPDGNLWFTEQRGIGRITTSGQVTQLPLPEGTQPSEIVAGPDGNLWFTDYGHQAIARLSVAGVIREFPLPRRSADPFGIAAGRDGRIWFTEAFGGRIGSIGLKVPEVLLSERIARFAGSAPETVTITNTGDASLAITTVRVTGVDGGLFMKGADTCNWTSVAPGATCSVQVAYSKGGAQGVQSAFLEIADNGTGSPHRVSLVAQLRPCYLPVVVNLTGSPPQGELIDMTTGRGLYEPRGQFESDSAASGVRTTAQPILYGQSSGYFDRAATRWLPVPSSSSVSPDGSRYAYTTFDTNGPRQLHVVDVATGLDHSFLLSSGFWGVVAFTEAGVYLHQSYEGIGPGLWLADPDTGAMRQVLKDGAVNMISGSTAWIGVWNAADKLPQPPGIGGGDNEILKQDLVTGATTAWLYLPGTNLFVVAVISGGAVISSYDGPNTKLWMVLSANQPQRMDFVFSTDPYMNFGGFVEDTQGLWIGTNDGVYLWTARTGPVLVSDVAATPAGTCA
jgi:streptogramin lyase